jgi:PPOX class probable F420-dependent enzyme
MAQTMAEAEWLAFLATGTRTGKLSTVRPGGAPHVVPVWFAVDGTELIVTTGADSVKGRNLARDPRVSLCVDDERPPYAFVLIEGRAELSSDQGALLEWSVRLARRYLGDGAAEEHGARNAGPGELLVRIRPERVVARSHVAD